MRSSGFLGALAGLFRWLGTPVRATRRLFPFSHEGRQTLVYLVFAGAGPALTLLTMWTMQQALAKSWQDTFNDLAKIVAAALLIIVCGLACFVSIRAIKVGKDGLDVQGRCPGEDDGITTLPPPPP